VHIVDHSRNDIVGFDLAALTYFMRSRSGFSLRHGAELTRP